MSLNETRYYGPTGSLYPHDIRHHPENPAFLTIHPDGGVLIRLHTEPGFQEAVLVYNDSDVHAFPMALRHETTRFSYWEIRFKPIRPQLRYAFALRCDDGKVVYYDHSGITSGVEFHFQLDLTTKTGFHTPEWVQGAFIYQIFPERFANGDPALNPPGSAPWGSPPGRFQFQGGDLVGVNQKLDYLQELGVEVIYLNPVFKSPSNHKYDTEDYYQVDPHFGGNQALQTLVANAHQRSMRVLLDASFNHCFPTFFAFQDIIQHGDDSAYWDWFNIKRFPIDVIIRPSSLPSWYWQKEDAAESWLQQFESLTNIPVRILEDDQDGPGMDLAYEGWFNVPNMPKINLTNPETREYFIQVAKHWIAEYQVDGWRMDVVPHIVEDFWLDMRREVKALRPDAHLLAEVWGDASFWLGGDRFDATMNYTFYYLCLEYFAKARMDTATFVAGFGSMLMSYADQVTAANQNLLSSHDTVRFRRHAGEDPLRHRLAMFFQFTVPGAPGVYYGDEIGMTGDHDPDCRRAFPWDQKDTWNHELLAQTKALARLRKEYPALRHGNWQLVWTGAEALTYLRQHEEQRILVLLARREPLKNQFIKVHTESPKHLWGNAQWNAVTGGIQIQNLTAWSGLVIQL
jgi:cyclomaltodextrinase